MEGRSRQYEKPYTRQYFLGSYCYGSNFQQDHLVKLLGVVDDPPELHLEYARRGPLSNLKNITISESVLVLTQCLSALSYLHGEQLAHRDIPPNNILVRSRAPFDVVLADFGLCKNATELRTQCGTILSDR